MSKKQMDWEREKKKARERVSLDIDGLYELKKIDLATFKNVEKVAQHPPT